MTRDEARRLASAFAMGDGLLHNVVKSVDGTRRDRAKELLDSLSSELAGNRDALVAVLLALGGVGQSARPGLVWTSPSLPGNEGHCTLAVSELINEAENHVFAATFTATKGSSYVVALGHALAKGVKVTLILDRERQKDYRRKTGWRVDAGLPGARIWTLKEPDPGVYAVQHAKLVMVDEVACLVTSANFSEAAAERNLECGVLVRDRGIAKSIGSHLASLRDHGHLVDYPTG
ncbi:DISARM system phospholipase D-like protein DrmC [Nocardioides panacis]|uniref:DISARM system phospholipase D-like protein DrmC n=1 Tax=Nocardioides panacis TaxID=2849501 RepID=UPI00265E250F|nr:DISARM system phospholipase D-like protein DrmC [Nocardioides panacis]